MNIYIYAANIFAVLFALVVVIAQVREQRVQSPGHGSTYIVFCTIMLLLIAALTALGIIEHFAA